MAADSKKARDEQRLIAFIDECTFQLDPVVRKTWSPIGDTPILRSKSSGDRVNVFSALVVEPETHAAGLWFAIETDTFDGDIVAGLLGDLADELPVDWTIILDHWSVHHRAVRLLADRDEFHVVRSDKDADDTEEDRDSTATTLAVEWLPTYAPDLNPVEGIWSQTKYGELGNFTPREVETLKSRVERSVAAKQNQTTLLQDYIRNAGLEPL